MDKIHSSDLVFSVVRPKFRLLESLEMIGLNTLTMILDID